MAVEKRRTKNLTGLLCKPREVGPSSITLSDGRLYPSITYLDSNPRPPHHLSRRCSVGRALSGRRDPKLWQQVSEQRQQMEPLVSDIWAELKKMHKTISRFRDARIEDKQNMDRMVSATVNWAILKAEFNRLTASRGPGETPAPCVQATRYTKAVALEEAWKLVVNELRTDKRIPDCSVNTVFRNAEYYLRGRFETHNRGGKSTAMKQDVAVVGAVVAAGYELAKSLLPLRTDPDLPNAPLGGFPWVTKGGWDAAMERGNEQGLPSLRNVPAYHQSTRKGLDVPVLAPPFFPSRRAFLPHLD